MANKYSDERFKRFWEAFPIHKGKQEAVRAWNRLSVKDQEAAIAAIPAYYAYCQRTGISYKYPQGWLNGRRFEDDYGEADKPVLQSEPSSLPSAEDCNKMDTW